ncbi:MULTISPECIES: HPr family phosphocarrier protein [Eubacteriales]|uniref:HPr family phosphocarrier protein n=1 Tax=Eubacteriales TaxID=186802 RepID=UPI000682E93D|nr:MULTISPECIES: HPr family phosphocarrier protein [Eubacteriales]
MALCKTQIMLTSIEEVKKFVSLTNQFPFGIHLTTDKYKIDAKSIMGVFSLDLSKPIQIEVDSDAPEVQDFLQQVAVFQRAS